MEFLWHHGIWQTHELCHCTITPQTLILNHVTGNMLSTQFGSQGIVSPSALTEIKKQFHLIAVYKWHSVVISWKQERFSILQLFYTLVAICSLYGGGGGYTWPHFQIIYCKNQVNRWFLKYWRDCPPIATHGFKQHFLVPISFSASFDSEELEEGLKGSNSVLKLVY